MPITDDKYKLLADRILDCLSRKITLSDDVIHYIDSTFSSPTADDLQKILQDDGDCEKDPLIELLFFPDENLQIELEDILENHRYSKQDEAILQACLSAEPHCIKFCLAADKETIDVGMPHAAIEQFVLRLNIAHNPDPETLKAINENVSEKHRRLLKVKLRNSRLKPSQNKREFLSCFFKKMDSAKKDYLGCFEFALSFLGDISEAEDIFETLMARKKFFFKHLQKARQFDEQLQANNMNMETLMLQGRRAAFINKTEAKDSMRLIDRICQTIFGQTRYFEQADSIGGRLKVDKAQDLDKLITSLQ